MTALGPIVDNRDAQRFEFTVDGGVAFVDYELTDHSIIFTHTEVPLGQRGRGIGSMLARGVLEVAQVRGFEVVPLCPFIASFIRSHPEYLDLVSESNRQRLDLDRR